MIEALADDEYRELQQFIAAHPEAGNLIQGGHGLRKLRWTISGKGKRGGTRIIYYRLKPKEMILMLFVFKKTERSDLTNDQLKTLRSIAAKELR